MIKQYVSIWLGMQDAGEDFNYEEALKKLK
jgi:hypothetical protein